ncbi:MAG: adenine-specific methyltransferase EcoRI family protein [Rhodobacteraceae bacterium]|nr:adenine-specific methyltransferase EcoRI family protein [Paracoccaceae bacterium]
MHDTKSSQNPGLAKSNQNAGLRSAQKAKKDEFYTRLADIENELRHYRAHFKGKTVFCNCDDPRVSNFFYYFSYGFAHLGLNKLITTCYKNRARDLFSMNDGETAISLAYLGEKNGNRVPDPEQIGIRQLVGDGDFRSDEAIKLLQESDIVVTNPPFSLFREYIGQLIEYEKNFLIIGNINAVTYKEVFPLIRDNKVWLGPSIRSGDRAFGVPNDYPLEAAGCGIDEDGNKFIKVKGVRWFTNMDFPARHQELVLHRKYNPDDYPMYHNYDAINVDKTRDIPVDYDGAMGVPITFLDRYNPNQFEILGSSGTLARRMSELAPKGTYRGNAGRFYLDNGNGTYRRLYDRVVIRKRQP